MQVVKHQNRARWVGKLYPWGYLKLNYKKKPNNSEQADASWPCFEQGISEQTTPRGPSQPKLLHNTISSCINSRACAFVHPLRNITTIGYGNLNIPNNTLSSAFFFVKVSNFWHKLN